MSDTINIVVTPKRFNEVFSIDDSFHFAELSDGKRYHYLCQFVVNDKGEYMDEKDARKLFKDIPRTELLEYFSRFTDAINDAFVNPTNAGKSSLPATAEQNPPQAG